MVSSGLLLAVVWWYWTMKMVRTVIDHRVVEVEILTDIVTDIKEIAQLIKGKVKIVEIKKDCEYNGYKEK
jgi:hypothetical protein